MRTAFTFMLVPGLKSYQHGLLKDWENSLARIALPPNSGNAHLRGVLRLLPVLDLGEKHALCAHVSVFPVLMLPILVTTGLTLPKPQSRIPCMSKRRAVLCRTPYPIPGTPYPSRASRSHLRRHAPFKHALCRVQRDSGIRDFQDNSKHTSSEQKHT